MWKPKKPDAEEEGWGYAPHSPPVLDDEGEVPVLRIPNEPGYFPTGAPPVLVSCDALIFQMHPKYLVKRSKPIASGALSLQDPSAGTASEVALVCECDGTLFYLKNDDATKKIAPNEFMLILPDDCIGVDLADSTSPDVLSHFEALLAARTLFQDESLEDKNKEIEYPEHLPDDNTSKTMYRMAKWTSKTIVKACGKATVKIEDYGQRRTSSVRDMQEKNIKESHIKLAEKTRKVSEKTHAGVEMLTDKISEMVGGSVAKHTEIKASDSETKKKFRRLVLASVISYGEVSDGVGEGYSMMSRQAKDEAVSYVEKKYGRSAAELARHTAGAAVNFGSAALTARRVVNVKSMGKSIAKKVLKDAILK